MSFLYFLNALFVAALYCLHEFLIRCKFPEFFDFLYLFLHCIIVCRAFSQSVLYHGLCGRFRFLGLASVTFIGFDIPQAEADLFNTWHKSPTIPLISSSDTLWGVDSASFNFLSMCKTSVLHRCSLNNSD